MTQLLIIILLFLGALTTTQATPEKTTGRLLWQSSGQDGLYIKALSGKDAQSYTEQIAQLRITMFRKYPYLYDGDMKNEESYLQTYWKSQKSTFLLLFNSEDEIVGLSSSRPLDEEMPEVKKPFLNTEIDLSKCLYIGETLIKEKYQGMQILDQMVKYYKEMVPKQAYECVLFMTVLREDNHPAKPDNYQPLDEIWKHYGFEVMKGKKIFLNWKRIDTQNEEENTLIVWGQSVQQQK